MPVQMLNPRFGSRRSRYGCIAEQGITAYMEECSIPVTESGCYLWLGSLDKNGYPSISYKGRTHSGHRLAYSILVGEIPKGAHVLHSCDTRSCINPKHLFLGSNDDNMRDMIRKGRAWFQKDTPK